MSNITTFIILNALLAGAVVLTLVWLLGQHGIRHGLRHDLRIIRRRTRRVERQVERDIAA